MALNIELLVYSLMWIFILSTYDNANGQDYPTYYEEDLPETGFSCSDKVNGAYYADIATACQMYHVCTRDENGFMINKKFLCENGTAFDQRLLVCQDPRKAHHCLDSERFYKKPSTFYERWDYTRQQAKEAKKQEFYNRMRALEKHPTYSEFNLPETSFTCEGKVNGGHYADIETGCQMYHICSKDRYGLMRSIKFLCGNGTIFNQRHLVCQNIKKAPRCEDSERYYRMPATFWANAAELEERWIREHKKIILVPHRDA